MIWILGNRIHLAGISMIWNFFHGFRDDQMFVGIYITRIDDLMKQVIRVVCIKPATPWICCVAILCFARK